MKAGTGILNCLNFLNTINTENPNSMILQFFFQGKSSELVKVFSNANAGCKNPGAGYTDQTGYYQCRCV